MATTIPIREAIRSLAPSATLLINEESKALIEAGKTVYKLGFGQSPFPVPNVVVEALQQHAGEKDYLPVQGLASLRTAVAHYYLHTHQLHYKKENIMIGPGSKELILQLQMVLDADLLLPSPSWVSYAPQAHIVGSHVHWINTTEQEKW